MVQEALNLRIQEQARFYDLTLDGSGDAGFKGNPALNAEISGLGKLIRSN